MLASGKISAPVVCLFVAAGLMASVTAPLYATPTEVEVLEPPVTLTLQGVPPLPAALAASARAYADLEGTRFVAWHPRMRSMIVSQRGLGAHQLFWLDSPLGVPRQITFHTEPTRTARFEPVQARYLVIARDTGGNEAHRLYRLDLDAALKDGARHEPVPLTPAYVKAEHWSFFPDGKLLLYATASLDRNTPAEDDDGPLAGDTGHLVSGVHVVDPLDPSRQRTLQTLNGRRVVGLRPVQGGRAIEVRASRDGRVSAWRIDLAGNRMSAEQRVPSGSALAPDSEESEATGEDAGPTRWLIRSDGEFRRLALGGSSTADARAYFLQDIPWDVERIAVPPREALPMPVVINEAGVSRLLWFDRGRRALAADRPPALEEGVIGELRWHPRLPLLALTHACAESPGDVYVHDAATGVLTRWTRAATLSAATPAPAARFARAQRIRWQTFDGREISGFRYDPPKRFTGPRPVLAILHGGPSSQSRPGFLGRNNYFLNELGITLIYPNVRGSTGFGRRFTSLDNGRRREDAVKDLVALLDWIGRQPDLDASKVIVSGGSYGGYLSSAIATRHPDRIAASITTVGIAHFVSLLQRTQSYRRDNRRQEYGDERDPAMREFLDRISPLTNAANIRKPILIAHGRNDPRVPYTEAVQLAAKVRAAQQAVWLVLAENEGHGFRKKDNADFLFYTTIAFVKAALGLADSAH
jgi:dipeptidyl aminopeptidase/acylaminoacyl peptidase